MKTLCLLVEYGRASGADGLFQGRPAAAWAAEALAAAFPGAPVAPLVPGPTPASFLAALQAAADGYDEVVLADADGPFLRTDVVLQIAEYHRRYRADYTFADGYPGGFACEILRPGILPLAAEWAAGQGGPVARDTFFSLLTTDINRFDVETVLSPVDLRGRRLSFTADSRRNQVLLDRYAADRTLATEALLEKIRATEGRARTLPATLHLQITDGALQVPVWWPPVPGEPSPLVRRTFLDRGLWNQTLDRMLAFAGDLTVLPGFWGEPSLHPEAAGLFADALDKAGLRLCVETSGLGWSRADLEALARHPRAEALAWIVDLDGADEAAYRQLRGEGFAEAEAAADTLGALFPGRVWPQAVRMRANEGQMEAFHQKWKARLGRSLIQKHNEFGGRLPREKPSDLSPWKRHACWHLARDLAVFLDGTTVVCHDDLDRSKPLGNLHTEDPAVVWARGDSWFANHADGRFEGVCRACDEWYTYHF